MNRSDTNFGLRRKQSRSSYDSSTIDDVDDELDEFLDDEEAESDEADGERILITSIYENFKIWPPYFIFFRKNRR